MSMAPVRCPFGISKDWHRPASTVFAKGSIELRGPKVVESANLTREGCI